ncbi:MaoC family dehydratase [Shimia sediminis]|uniref:MaoC family dehydratase n=1 Tax=Shimia sediminis TaxID=2497945 RepID=UPI001F48E298|nr:MaoC family dehydratase [Shimia sediminis]
MTDGDRVDLGLVEVTPLLIDRFAELTGDRFEIHMDDAAAQAHGFERRIAHGLLVLSLIDGLKNQADAQFEALASLGWDWRFTAPVLAGDTIKADLVVLEKRETTKPDRGILDLQFDARNQKGDLVQQGTNKLLVYR